MESHSNEYKSSVLQLKVLEMILLDLIKATALPAPPPSSPPALYSSGNGSCSEDLKAFISSAFSPAIVDPEKKLLHRISRLESLKFQILQSGNSVQELLPSTCVPRAPD